jgi:hypothetical protein
VPAKLPAKRTAVNIDADAFLRKGLALEAQIMAASEQIRESSKNSYKSEWLDSRLVLCSIMSSILEAKSGVPGAATASTS